VTRDLIHRGLPNGTIEPDGAWWTRRRLDPPSDKLSRAVVLRGDHAPSRASPSSFTGRSRPPWTSSSGSTAPRSPRQRIDPLGRCWATSRVPPDRRQWVDWAGPRTAQSGCRCPSRRSRRPFWAREHIVRWKLRGHPGREVRWVPLGRRATGIHGATGAFWPHRSNRTHGRHVPSGGKKLLEAVHRPPTPRDVVIVSSNPSDDDTWTVTAAESILVVGNWLVTAHAIWATVTRSEMRREGPNRGGGLRGSVRVPS
jgi:hypothetical protein